MDIDIREENGEVLDGPHEKLDVRHAAGLETDLVERHDVQRGGLGAHVLGEVLESQTGDAGPELGLGGGEDGGHRDDVVWQCVRVRGLDRTDQTTDQ